MKTNTIKGTIIASVLGVVALVGLASVAVTYLPELIGFLAVGILIALAEVDYRVGPKNYTR